MSYSMYVVDAVSSLHFGKRAGFVELITIADDDRGVLRS
jgi:hypothetical protein